MRHESTTIMDFAVTAQCEMYLWRRRYSAAGSLRSFTAAPSASRSMKGGLGQCALHQIRIHECWTVRWRRDRRDKEHKTEIAARSGLVGAKRHPEASSVRRGTRKPRPCGCGIPLAGARDLLAQGSPGAGATWRATARSAAGRSPPFPRSDVRPGARGLLPGEAKPGAMDGQYTPVDSAVDNMGRRRGVAVDGPGHACEVRG
jgi:hypothetical protein